jgi:predicted CopG family antitoxin
MKYKTINVKVSEETYNQLIRLKHELSIKWNEDWSMSDVVKKALESCYDIED